MPTLLKLTAHPHLSERGGGGHFPPPRKANDLLLLRRLFWTAVVAWSLAICIFLAFNLNLMQAPSVSVPEEVTRSIEVSLAIIWLLGLTGITLAAHRVHLHLKQRLATLGELELSAKVFEDGLQAIVITTSQGEIIRVNPMFSEMTGFEPEDVIGRNLSILETDTHGPDFIADLWHELKSEGSWVGEVWKRRKNGETFATWESASAVDDEAGNHLGYIFMFQDITDRKLFSSRLEQLAHFDPLTHLPNRRLLSDRVDHAVQRASRSDDQHALLFIDLDHFKRINDTIGHISGDRLLTVIAERLLKCVRTSDTVARLGGDEFAVLLEDITPMDVERIADKILASLAAPVELEGRDWYIGASIGISLTPRDGADMTTLLKNADTAMYRAKADGRHCFRFFDEGMAEQATLQVARETALHLAVERKAFVLHYQPQLDMVTGEVIGVEALIRWYQGDKMISPMEFIPLAEETGHIVPIGHWVLTTACRDIKSLHAEGYDNLKLAVNISAVELKQGDFIEQILMALAESGFPPDRLELEITESTMMVDVARVANVLDALSATGISLSIDDFGTGYSSLSYLKQLPVDFIKIDRSFVRDVPQDKEDCTIVRAIVTMTHALGLHVVAEGVETEEQLQFLRNEDCDISQGYLISRPVPLDELRQWLNNRNHSNA
ncbi:MAG: EAL domain-containing protein [Parasulfuritortus sp.]|nr:EAL domain-containing protein [Parasulfuritortus sp.]